MVDLSSPAKARLTSTSRPSRSTTANASGDPLISSR